MIKTFQHKGLKKFFEKGILSGIQKKHADKLRRQLMVLNRAVEANDMNLPGWRLHSLHKNLKGHWAVDVSGNWRLTFRFESGDVVLVDYTDYH